MDMLVLEKTPTCTEVALRGRLDTAGAAQIDLAFTSAVAPRRVHAIVDLSGVEFISSMGLRMLISVARALAANRSKMIVHSASELVAEAIDMAAIDELVALVPDRTSALAQLGS